MAHLFRYPAGGGYTHTITLNPALVTIQEERIRPVQRTHETADGTLWSYQLSANRRQTYTVIVDFLHEDDDGINTGYTNLKAFFDSPVNYMMNTFDLTHDDGGTTEVKFMSPEWQFDEVQFERWTGRFSLAKVV